MKGHIIISLLRFIYIPHIFVEYNLLNCLKTFFNKKKVQLYSYYIYRGKHMDKLKSKNKSRNPYLIYDS